MADNVTVTPGAGVTIATDEIGGVMYQRVKIAVGADGAAADVHSGNPLPVTGALTDGQLRAAAVPVTGPLDNTQLRAAPVPVSGQVSGIVAVPSATFNRPADTTAYASGDLVANSVTAGTVTPISLTAARVAAGSFSIRRVKLKKSSGGLTNAAFRVHFYDVSPTVSNGDNGAWLSNQSDGYLGSVDITIDKAFTDGAVGHASPDAGDITRKLASGQTIFALIEARAAYTPVSGETFRVDLDLVQD